jgi:myo-inositol-1(or 4)-monophosphatase
LSAPHADPDGLAAIARRAAESAGRVALAWWRRLPELNVETKADPDDLVSRADREAEEAARAAIGEARPDDTILGEELPDEKGSTGIEWLIDPIDGTLGYLYGRPDWGVSVAAREGGGRVVAATVAEPVLGRVTWASSGGGTWQDGKRVSASATEDLERALIEINFGRISQRHHVAPLMELLVPGARDVRRGSSAAVALAQVADGRSDAFWGPGLQPWDGAAGLLLAKEAGARVGDLDRADVEAWPKSGAILAAAPALWDELRDLIASVFEG